METSLETRLRSNSRTGVPATMPIYKNRKPMQADAEVRHYTSLEAVVSMLRTGQLRMTRVDAFSDPFEGSVPKQTIDDQAIIINGSQAAEMMMASVAAHYPGEKFVRAPYRDRWSELTRRRRAMTRSAHAMCWAAGHESEALWRLYCREGGPGLGLVLRTTLGKLEESLAQHDLYVSPVHYRFYHEGPGFNDDRDALMHKRKAFEYENEVRLLTFDQAHYNALSSSIGGYCPAPESELQKYVSLEWALSEALDGITVSPFASEAYEFIARTALLAVDPKAASMLELSELSQRRYAPLF